MYKISDKFIIFITEAIKKWNVELAAGRQTRAEVKINDIKLFAKNAKEPDPN